MAATGPTARKMPTGYRGALNPALWNVGVRLRCSPFRHWHQQVLGTCLVSPHTRTHLQLAQLRQGSTSRFRKRRHTAWQNKFVRRHSYHDTDMFQSAAGTVLQYLVRQAVGPARPHCERTTECRSTIMYACEARNTFFPPTHTTSCPA